jgi:hypothetical protein
MRLGEHPEIPDIGKNVSAFPKENHGKEHRILTIFRTAIILFY